MIIVNVQLKSLEVSKFNIKEGLQFAISFDDGEPRCINKSSLIEDHQLLAEEIIKDIRQMEKRYNQQYGGDSFDDVIIIRFEDEEKVMQKMASFFLNIKEKVNSVRLSTDSQNYLNKINEINRLKLNFS